MTHRRQPTYFIIKLASDDPFQKTVCDVQKPHHIRFEHNDLKLEVNVSPSEETVWLSLDDMAMLFGRDRSVIGKHVKNALLEECEKNSVWAKFARTGFDGETYYVDYYKTIL